MTVPLDLDRRFRAAAARSGLLDVAYATVDSPVGPLLLAGTTQGLCRISFAPEEERELDQLARAHGVRVLRSPAALEPARRELEEYFDGRRQRFEIAVDLTGLTRFQRCVLDELARIPFGKTETYGGLAGRISRPRAARAVGGALNRNPLPIVLPCHRVVGSDGSLVGYAGGLDRKRLLLRLEAGRRRQGSQAQSKGA